MLAMSKNVSGLLMAFILAATASSPQFAQAADEEPNSKVDRRIRTDCTALTDAECTVVRCAYKKWMPEIRRRLRAVDRKLPRERYMQELAALTVKSVPEEDAKLDLQSECVGSLAMTSGYGNSRQTPGLECASNVPGTIAWEFGDAFTYEKQKFFIALKRYAGSYNQVLLDNGILDGSECKAVSYSTEASERALRRAEQRREREK